MPNRQRFGGEIGDGAVNYSYKKQYDIVISIHGMRIALNSRNPVRRSPGGRSPGN
jgi:hypothetical protein